MDHRMFARCLLTALSGIQGIATVAIDVNRTHATHPLWPGHARFHVVWQSTSTALLSIVTIWMIWKFAASADVFYLAAALTGLPNLAFLAAFFFRKTYSGTLSDPQGIGPFQSRLLGFTIRLDGNLAAVVAAIATLAVILITYTR